MSRPTSAPSPESRELRHRNSIPGYQDGIMPANFETSLTPEDLEGLVDYLSSGVNGGGAAKQ
jgi:hypothetical protein